MAVIVVRVIVNHVMKACSKRRSYLSSIVNTEKNFDLIEKARVKLTKARKYTKEEDFKLNANNILVELVSKLDCWKVE